MLMLKDNFTALLFHSEENPVYILYMYMYCIHILLRVHGECVYYVLSIDSDLANSFQAEYGHDDAFSLSDVFWTCSNMFANM